MEVTTLVTHRADGMHAYHLVRCDMPEAVYEKDATGHYSIRIPFDRCAAQNGTHVFYIELLCFSSCPGGLNRRPFEVTVSLEHSSRILGCDSIDTRVCACPGRDRGAAEKRLRGDIGKKRGRKKKKPPTEPTVSMQDDNKIHTLLVQGRTHYAILHHLVEGLDATVASSSSPPPSSSSSAAAAVLSSSAARNQAPSADKPLSEASFPAGNDAEETPGGDTEPESEADDDNDEEEDEQQQLTPRQQVKYAFLNLRLQEAVRAWLSALRLEAYADMFMSKGYDDLDVVCDLTQDDLDCLGISRPGHRKKLLLAAQKLKSLLHQARAVEAVPDRRLHKTLSISRTTYRQALPSAD
ncbi:hypothetical protein PTSG_07599 [Salpingoeca rosetta]|uniref:SAM domain-containing protein n=1 Tax=Salpingoeca rosetta (strain ATCC 50818 / BSB-021) TaxID=946362 RepID=F2UH84_SALR5|nr:uncharacterized protein PTSG_07599 [Salpingoeca rosetta]EGD76483.1 hypothetical protein PTSG_07599 [Salpingoeca rosetta]|eukprot:XP_004991397.1 hypothetical protein PTSG_07599 [Salpingoeca rosetta]